MGLLTEQEKVSFRAAILLNILTSARTLVEAMDKLKIPYGFDPSDTEKYGELKNHGASVTNMAKSIPSSRRQTLGASGSIIQLASVGSEAKQSLLDLKVSHMDGLVDVPKDATARLAEILYNKQKVPETSPVYWASDRVRGLELIPYAIPGDAVDAIKCVWNDPGIQYCYSRRGEVQLMDTCAL
ncbi:hypothetical protein BCR33DRAFT_767380 [Rhizoclosmatium globosum]|uniref:Uncharacterized protein n=1 Tax=Rhizoclosmatium globosum TaxID=329046 RepID=A0A1Y2C3D2_9FUNG|nr:hypothetical protein BCR33DRAFT_767380 [Rhizoclosmatium globosum]|eukprot:ORY41511.1 hypothetical protein BCR33DRAFT_767380 [Rhizoclosmatium globosum]